MPPAPAPVRLVIRHLPGTWRCCACGDEAHATSHVVCLATGEDAAYPLGMAFCPRCLDSHGLAHCLDLGVQASEARCLAAAEAGALDAGEVRAEFATVRHAITAGRIFWVPPPGPQATAENPTRPRCSVR